MKKENEIIINDKPYEIKLVRMKYMKNNFYSNYMVLKQHGILKLFKFTDAEEVLINFLTAIFDNEEIAKEVFDELDTKVMSTLLIITKKLNEIEDEPVPNETALKEKA